MIIFSYSKVNLVLIIYHNDEHVTISTLHNASVDIQEYIKYLIKNKYYIIHADYFLIATKILFLILGQKNEKILRRRKSQIK
jgi:hypothetical protein